MSARVSVIIPAYNESARIGRVLREVKPFADEVLVIDDGSQDKTAEIALACGARVIRQENSGYIKSIKHGFKQAIGDIMVTLDADGEHNPADIPRLTQPIFYYPQVTPQRILSVSQLSSQTVGLRKIRPAALTYCS